MRVLVVEDDVAVASSIELMLKSENFNVYTTDLGEEGIDLGKLYDYGTILLDLKLPDTGTRWLRSNSTTVTCGWAGAEPTSWSSSASSIVSFSSRRRAVRSSTSLRSRSNPSVRSNTPSTMPRTSSSMALAVSSE